MSKAKIRVAILSRQKSKGSAELIRSSFLVAGHEVDVVNPLDLSLSLGVGTLFMHRNGKPIPHYDAVIARIGHSITTHGIAVLRHFELLGVPTFPTPLALQRSRHKFDALQHLSTAGVPVPPTTYVHRVKDLDDAIARLGGAPLIVKVLEGTGGQGVILAESDRTASAMAATLVQAGRPVLLQQFVSESSGRDTRVFVVGDQAVGAARRVAKAGEYRSNVHLGATATAAEVTEEMAVTAVRAVKCLGLEIGGVDILSGNDGPLVLEVNSSPGITDFAATTGVDVGTHIVQHIEKRVLASK